MFSTGMWRGIAALGVGSLCSLSGHSKAATGSSGDREELAIARRKHTPSTGAQQIFEAKSRSLEQEEDDDGMPALRVRIEEAKEGPQLPVEEEECSSNPGVRIEEMEVNWTKQAPTPATPGAVLDNVRSVYSELSDDILVRG